MKTAYRLYVGWYLKVMVFGMLGVFSMVGVGILLPGALDGPPLMFGLFWLGVLSFMWYQVLTMPHRIEVDDGGLVTFVSILKRVEVPSGGIQSIQPRTGQFGFLVVHHQSGKINLLSQFDEFHVFLTDLKTRNPSVQLRGC